MHPADSVSSRLMSLAFETDTRPAPSVDLRVRAVEERISRITQAEENKFSALSDQTAKLSEQLHTLRLGNEEERSDFIKIPADSFSHEIVSVSLARAETETRLEKIASARAAQLVEEVKRERGTRETVKGSGLREMGGAVGKLFGDLERVRNNRVDKGDKLSLAIHSEVDKLANALDAEKKIRVQQQTQVLRMMEEMCLRIQAEIQGERNERQLTQEHLLNLLEETCTKVEANFLFKPRAY